MSETLAQVGEKEILNRLKRFMPIGQIDDDTAQINTFGKELLINTDLLVEGVHFSQETTSAKDVGWRSVAANLSDLACSGVDEILGITVGLVAPPSTPFEWVENVYRGMEEALEIFGGVLLGGDCSKGTQKLLAITAIGTLGPLRLHRSNARPGDWLLTSGPHGLSRLGLAILLSDPVVKIESLSETLKANAIRAHQRPHPPLKVLNALTKSKPKGLPWRAAGTDSSDGLLEAIQGICSSSNCQAVLNQSSLPRSQDWPTGAHWDNWCLAGGEDFELILSLPEIWAKALIKNLPTMKVIGLIKNGPPKIIWNDGQDVYQPNKIEFKHF